MLRTICQGEMQENCSLSFAEYLHLLVQLKVHNLTKEHSHKIDSDTKVKRFFFFNL